MSIIDRIGSIAETDTGKAMGFAHRHFQERVGEHGHSGRALVETIAEVARNHPAAVGFVVGVVVEQLLAHEKHVYEEHHHPGLAQLNGGGHAAHADGHAASLSHEAQHHFVIRLATLKPGKLAFEVFGALVLLKLGAVGAKMVRRRKQGEVWFAPAAKIKLWSATFAAFHGAKALRSHQVSAWRNAWFVLFLTDALKPLLKPRRGGPPPRPASALVPARVEAPAPTHAELPAPHGEEPRESHDHAETAGHNDAFAIEPHTTH